MQIFADDKEVEITQVSNDQKTGSFSSTDESSTLNPDLNEKQAENKSVVIVEREGECIISITSIQTCFPAHNV